MKTHKKEYAVIGLGRFGGSLCKELSAIGMKVLAIDKDPEKVDKYTHHVAQAVHANVTDEKTLNALGIRNFEYVIISFGDDIQASILTTLILKEMGIKNVWVKAQNDYHQKVLEKIGADRIIHPEREMAVRIAHHIVSEKIIDYIQVSKEYSIVEIIAGEKIDGKTLKDVNARANYRSTIIALKSGENISVSPGPEEVINSGDIIVAIGKEKDLQLFEREGV